MIMIIKNVNIVFLIIIRLKVNVVHFLAIIYKINVLINNKHIIVKNLMIKINVFNVNMIII